MGQRWAAWIVALVITGALGCHPSVRVPMLGFGPARADDPSVLDDALQAARASQHAPMHTDAAQGRFSVRANSDPTRQTIFVVQCSRDGYLVIRPEGNGVVRVGDAFEMSSETREEYAAFALALERAIPEAP